MQSINLLLKVLWSPGEAMFLLSKTPRIVAPIVFLCLFSLLTGAVVMTKLDSAELAMRTIERSARGGQLTEEQKEQFRKQMSSPIVKGFSIAAGVIGPVVMIAIVAGLYFGLFTMLGRDGSFKAFFR